VEAAVLATVQAHISLAIDIDNAMKQMEALDWEQREIRKINAQIKVLGIDIDKFSRIKLDLYEDLKSELISREEFLTFKEDYDNRIDMLKQQISELVSQRNAVECGLTNAQGWFAQFRKYENIEKLTRNGIVSLIERIEINERKDIHVKFRHADQFTAALEYLDTAEKTTNVISGKEIEKDGKNIPQTGNTTAKSGSF
jgi:hypothetical protein